MSILFLNYPKCTTCIKARKWLEENNIEFTSRHIVEENPTAEELKTFIKLSGLPTDMIPIKDTYILSTN